MSEESVTGRTVSREATGRLDRVFRALERLAAAPGGLTLSNLAEQLGLSPSSAHDLLRGLVDAEMVVRRGRRYTLGPRAVGLAVSVVDSLDFLAPAREKAATLSHITGEDVLVATRLGSTVGYVYKHPGSIPLKVNVTIGEPRPLHSTSVGKLFAAFCDDLRANALSNERSLPAYTSQTISDVGRLADELNRIKDLSFAVSNGEAIEDVIGFAAPIFDARRQLVGALHVSLPSQRCEADHVTTIVTNMVEKANEVTAHIGGPAVDIPAELPTRVLDHLAVSASADTTSVAT